MSDKEVKRFTAQNMHHSPAQVYRAADKGHPVEITHAHYPDQVFRLVTGDKDNKDSTGA